MAGQGGPVDDNVWLMRQMGQGEREGKNMERGDVKASTIENDEVHRQTNSLNIKSILSNTIWFSSSL